MLHYGGLDFPSGFDISGLKPEPVEEEPVEEELESQSLEVPIPSSIDFELISTYDTESAMGALDGNYAYIADNLYGGLRVVDITDPYNP